MSTFDPRYTVSEVAHAAGLPVATVKTWRQSRAVPVGDSSAGWTRYSVGDAIVLAVVRELNRRGISAASAFLAVMDMGHRLHSADIVSWRPDHPDDLVTMSASLTVFDVLKAHEDATGGWRFADQAPAPSEPAMVVLILDLGAIRAKVRRALGVEGGQ
jgi:hypothetical protein